MRELDGAQELARSSLLAARGGREGPLMSRRPPGDGRRAHAGRWRGAARRGRTGASEAGLSLGEALRALLESMGGTPERAGLQRLWDNWESALGAELAALAMPLGHRAARPSARAGGREGATLLLGAEDAMLMQELRFRGDEILARVNAFLGRPYFSAVQVSLPLGRSAPERSRQQRAAAAVMQEPVKKGTPSPRGIFLDAMNPDSPVARCYARFVQRREKEAPSPAAAPKSERPPSGGE